MRSRHSGARLTTLRQSLVSTSKIIDFTQSIVGIGSVVLFGLAAFANFSVREGFLGVATI